MESIKLFFAKIIFAQSTDPILYSKIYKLAEYGLALFLILSLITSIRRGDFLILISAISGLISGFVVIYYAKTLFKILIAIFKFIYSALAWVIKYLIWSWLKYILIALKWVWNTLIWSWLKYINLAINWLLKILIWSWFQYVVLAIKWLVKYLIWSWLKYIFIALLWVWNNLIWFWLKYVLIAIVILAVAIYYSIYFFLDLLQSRAGRKGSFLSAFILGILIALVYLLNHSLFLYLFIASCLVRNFGYLQDIFSKMELEFIFHTMEIMKYMTENFI